MSPILAATITCALLTAYVGAALLWRSCRYQRVGGIRFLRVGVLCLSFCISRRRLQS